MNIVKNLNKINWHKIAQYKECILMKYLGFDSMRNPVCKKEVKASYRIRTFLDFDHVEYIDWNEIEEWNEYLNKKFKRNKEFFNQYVKLCLKRCRECVEYSKKIKKIDPKKQNPKKLIKIFDEYLLRILKVMPFVYTLSIFEQFLIGKLKNNLENRRIREKQILNCLLELSNPRKEIFSVKQKKELLKLAKEIQKTDFFLKNKNKIKKLTLEDFPKEIRKKIEAHRKKYAWMGILFMLGRPYSVSKFLEDLKIFLVKNAQEELEKLIEEKKEREHKISRLIKDLNFSNDERFILRVIRDLAFLRAFRIDMINISNYFALGFLENIADQCGLCYEDFLYLTPSEIKETLLNKKDYTNKIKIRKQGWGLFLYKNDLELIVGKKYQIIKKEIFSKDYSQYEYVKGMTAYPGKVAGKAFVAMSADELKGISEKDILIAPETTVDFEIAMAKAKAIITDRGGILSHAAIVAREFKKPCVIGTNIATKVFKTGDYIEVDAEKGVVKVIKRAK